MGISEYYSFFLLGEKSFFHSTKGSACSISSSTQIVVAPINYSQSNKFRTCNKAASCTHYLPLDQFIALCYLETMTASYRKLILRNLILRIEGVKICPHPELEAIDNKSLHDLWIKDYDVDETPLSSACWEELLDDALGIASQVKEGGCVLHMELGDGFHWAPPLELLNRCVKARCELELYAPEEVDAMTNAHLYLYHSRAADVQAIDESLKQRYPALSYEDDEEDEEEEDDEQRVFYSLGEGLSGQEMLVEMRRYAQQFARSVSSHASAEFDFLLHEHVPAPQMRLYLDHECTLRALATCSSAFTWAALAAAPIRQVESEPPSFFILGAHHQGVALLCSAWRDAAERLGEGAEQMDYYEWEGMSFVVFSYDVMRSYNRFIQEAWETLPHGAELQLSYWMPSSGCYTEIRLEAASIERLYAGEHSLRLDVHRGFFIDPVNTTMTTRLAAHILSETGKENEPVS